MMLTPAERTDRGVVGQADGPHSAEQARSAMLLRERTGTEHGAGIHEEGTAHAEILGDKGQREAHLRRGRPVGLATQSVAGQRSRGPTPPRLKPRIVSPPL